MSSTSNPADDLANQIASAVMRRLGGGGPEISRIVADEIQQALREQPVTAPAGVQARVDASTSRLLVTANGRNRTGIIARLSAAIDELDGDIRDLSQTIVGDYFTTLFVVDMAGAAREGPTFAQLRQRLKQVGEELGIHVVVLHDDILSTMHTV